MKTYNITLRHTIFGVIALFLTLTLFSCSKKVRFQNSSVVPAAQGKVKISKTDNGNYQLDLSIVNLAEPSKLTPSKKYYVVWINTSDKRTLSLGQLKSSTGYFSSLLKADMRATTPYKPIKVFITSEDDAIVNNPGKVIFMTDSF